MRKPVIAALLLLAAGSAALALQPFGVGTPYGSGQVTATTTTACVAVSGAATCMLFPAGTSAGHQVRVATLIAEAKVTCCWTGATAGIGINDDGIGTDTNGANGVGSGACATFGGGSILPVRVDARPRFAQTRHVPGGSTGICPVVQSNSGDSTSSSPASGLYAPCRIDSDCTGFGGGVCNLTPTNTQLANVGMYALCEAATGTAEVHATKENVDP